MMIPGLLIVELFIASGSINEVKAGTSLRKAKFIVVRAIYILSVPNECWFIFREFCDSRVLFPGLESRSVPDLPGDRTPKRSGLEMFRLFPKLSPVLPNSGFSGRFQP